MVQAKCSDLCSVDVYDESGELIGSIDGYAPDFFPDGGGDYLRFEIDLATGKILNWTPPTDEAILECIDAQVDED